MRAALVLPSAQVRKRRVILNVFKRVCEPVFTAWAEEMRRNRRQRQLSNRMRRRLMYSRAFGTLRAVAAEEARLGTLVRRMRHSGTYRAWRVWEQHAEERRRLAKFGRRMLQSGLARSWLAWQTMRMSA